MRAGKRFVRFAHVDGISDIIGLLPDGRFLAIECKIAPNKPSEHQAEFLSSVAKQGGVALVIYEVNQLARAIDAIREGRVCDGGVQIL